MAKNNKVEILTIGDEILYGQITDTNSQWISTCLDAAGFRTIRKTTVGDEKNTILQAFREAEERADVILITGGLGPTDDDLTKPCLAEYFNCGLEMNNQALEELKEFFQGKGLELTELNRQQASLPACSEHITNELGTAAGMWIERNGKVFISMPGVPHEMKLMMNKYVIPKLSKKYSTEVVYHKLIKTIGIGESWLSEKIAPWAQSLPAHIRLAYLPSLGQVKLRLTASGESLGELQKQVDGEIEKLQEYAGRFIYGYDSDEIEATVGKMLSSENLTLGTAESCTGGFLAHKITSIPGSSEYFLGGVISYDNTVKVNTLGVKQETLDAYGAVSEETAIEMARGIRRIMNTDVGVATTGIAGPGGGTPEKPVGSVWIACDFQGTVQTKKLQLWKDRQVNIQASTVAVLNLIRITLSKTIEEKT
jgi:nicotinamide-nucleotide amidase